MKKMIPVCLLLLAMAVGLFLPSGYMLIMDESLTKLETIDMTEPTLQTGMAVVDKVEKLLESQTVARRLMEFRNGAVVMPTDTLAHGDGVESASGGEAVRIATNLMNDLVEGPFDPHEIIMANLLVLMTENVIARVWQVEIHFNRNWIAKMIIDVDNEAVLQMDIRNGEGIALWRLFWEDDSGMEKAEWVECVTQRIGECLSDYMGAGSSGRVEVIPNRRMAVVTIEGDPPTRVEVPFTMELYRGIYFNVGSKS